MLLHFQPFSTLLPSRQRRDLCRQRVDILFVPDGEGVPRQGDRAALVIGAVIGCVVADGRAFLGRFFTPSDHTSIVDMFLFSPFVFKSN